MSSFIYSYFQEEKIREVISAYHACTNLHVQLLDENGDILFEEGTQAPFCREFIRHLPKGDSCKKQHSEAGRHALQFGEAYLFSCHGGLYHIVYPLIKKSVLFGSVIAGPFLMDEMDSSLLMDLDQRFDIDKKSLLTLSELSYQIRVIPPDLANQYSRLLYYLIDGLNAGSRELLAANQEKLLQQSRINESIQMYKNSGAREDREYPIEKENLLISKIKIGDTAEARAILNELLGFLLLYENHDVSRIKVRIIELCTLLSRAAIERGSETELVLRTSDRLISQIISSQDIYDICYNFQNNMEIFTESLFFSSEKNSRLIKQAAEYISKNFAEPITLSEVAKYVHLNTAYLSTLFKQVTGHSFREYLNQIRIEEAKRLLEHTDYSIMEITVACGFSDQSYFSKVFKKHTGLTPKQYR